jgi:hypothetical protein
VAPLVFRFRYLVVAHKSLPAAAPIEHRKATVCSYCGTQAVARGCARCASKLLDHCTRPLPAAPRR